MNWKEEYRDRISDLPPTGGCYCLVDLLGRPFYVGQTTEGLRKRISMHTTTGRSDIVATRAMDVYFLSSVYYWECENSRELERVLIWKFHREGFLINADPGQPGLVGPGSVHQLLPLQEWNRRLDPESYRDAQVRHVEELKRYIANTPIGGKKQKNLERILRHRISEIDNVIPWVMRSDRLG